MTSDTYRAWASAYDLFEREASVDTWRRGIVPELQRAGCDEHRILDLGAGTGIGRRVLLEAFPRCTVVSLEQSPEMLAAGGVPPERSMLGDMTDFHCDGRFDFVVAGFDALNCLPKIDLARCLSCAAAVLGTGGRVIFDYSSRKLLKYDWGHFDCTRDSGDLHLACRFRYEPLLDRTRIELCLSDKERELWRETHHHYAIDPFDLHELAMLGGLAALRVRDIDGETFNPAATTHVWVLALAES